MFQRALPAGVCVAVSLPEEDDFATPAGLHPDEVAFVHASPAAQRRSFFGGRVALRAAMAALGAGAPGGAQPILSTPRGAPAMPPGFVGSVSHKRTVAVALCARESRPRATIGVDVEDSRPLRTDIASRVLTSEELAVTPASGPERDASVLLRFSAKEAIYKAVDPWVHRFVGFQEASVACAPDGALTGRLALVKGEGPFAVELHRARVEDEDGLILVAARVRPTAAVPV